MNIVIIIPDNIVDAAMKQVAKRAEGCNLSMQMKRRIIMRAVNKAVASDPALIRTALNNMSNQEFYDVQVLQGE